jgi:hypothetical protein
MTLISLCLHMNISHLSIPTRVSLYKLSQAVDQATRLHIEQWPGMHISCGIEDRFFVTVPDEIDSIVHSRMPSDLKAAMQLANGLSIRVLQIDEDGEVLEQLL